MQIYFNILKKLTQPKTIRKSKIIIKVHEYGPTSNIYIIYSKNPKTNPKPNLNLTLIQRQK